MADLTSLFPGVSIRTETGRHTIVAGVDHDGITLADCNPPTELSGPLRLAWWVMTPDGNRVCSFLEREGGKQAAEGMARMCDRAPPSLILPDKAEVTTSITQSERSD